jgi:hypothetical protein
MLALEFLTVGAWGFWILLVISAIVASELLDTDHPGMATFLAIAVVAVLAVFGDFNPFVWIAHNPWEAVVWLIGYFAIGAAWSVGKWAFWLNKSKRRIQDLLADNPSRKLRDLAYDFHRLKLPTDFPPKVGKYKSRIIGWITLWPASVAWTCLNDPVRWIGEQIYAHIGSMMQRISNRIFQDFDKSL